MSLRQRTILLEGKSFAYSLRRSRRARSLLLHVDVSGAIEVVVPWPASFREAEKFVLERRRWLMRALRDSEDKRRSVPKRILTNGELLPLFGQWRRLQVCYDSGRRRCRYREELDSITVFVARQRDVRQVLVRWYKQKAHTYFSRRASVFAHQLGVLIDAVAVSAARTQWGSCITQTGRISVNWRLALGPSAVADYVVAHEVAHLRERLHAKDFWQLVRCLDTCYEAHRRWLRHSGHTLVL